MSKRIPNGDWANQQESAIRQFVNEKLELINVGRNETFPRD